MFKKFDLLGTLSLLGVLFLVTPSLKGQSITIDFEDEKEWLTKGSYWSISSEEAVSGGNSLKISLTEGNLITNPALISVDVDHTMQKVRTAKGLSGNIVVASSYEGAMFGISYTGEILWKNDMSGFMVHDIWVDDLTGDGIDEIVLANADGAVYCLNIAGKLLWEFKPSEVPMYAVTIVHKEGVPYVVCGGLDLSIYYLSKTGEEMFEIPSSTYSIEKPWGTNTPPDNLHYANFLRPVRKADGTEILALHGSHNHMQGKGTLYLFEVLEQLPFNKIPVGGSIQIGEFRTSDADGNGVEEIVLGFSGHQKSTKAVRFDLNRDLTKEWGKTDWEEYPYNLDFGYSVLQPELIEDGGIKKYLFLVGNDLILGNADFQPGGEEVLKSKYSYNDMWKDEEKIILASAQSGGSCIHIIDTSHEDWKASYTKLVPPGKIQKILNNTEEYRNNISAYTKQTGERDPLPVYLMTENTDEGLALSVSNDIKSNYASPIFLGGSHMSQAEDWDRTGMENEKFKEKRDSRRSYVYTQQEAIDHITPWYDGEPGIAYWGGHGNDPYMFQLSTTKQILDAANGKKTVLIYPELEDHSSDFAWVMEDLFYPLAEYSSTRNANIFVRTKHNFWQGNAYLPMWERMLDGEFADVFVPSMEETTDKAMDVSIAGRVGMWTSGAVNQWGTRAVPDNPSFDRSRQFSHQMLPTHFMRHIIYHIAYGAQYINNFSVDQEYMSFIWELIAKGALYIPKTEEIISFSPVHLGMKAPDEHFLMEGSSLKWSTFYDEEFEAQNPFVFSRQNATWMGAKVNDWDFSAYAAGVKDRRQNYLPNYPNGLVLITPPQNGTFAKVGVPRKNLKEHLHPIYADILKEYITDGRKYYSSDGGQSFEADVHVSEIVAELANSSLKLPISVEGDVAWVAAQTSPRNIRLTIIDGGYLNPDDRKAVVRFNTITPVGITDILDGKSFSVANQETIIDIPCGLFRFIDVELAEDLE